MVRNAGLGQQLAQVLREGPPCVVLLFIAFEKEFDLDAKPEQVVLGHLYHGRGWKQ